MKKTLTLIFLALLISFLVQPANAQRAWTPADTLRIANVSDAQISPDGAWVVYTVSTVDGNATRTTLCLARSLRPAITFGVRYPREGHGLREPRHRLDALERTLTWFDKFLK